MSLGFVIIEIAESLVISRAYRNNYDLFRDTQGASTMTVSTVEVL